MLKHVRKSRGCAAENLVVILGLFRRFVEGAFLRMSRIISERSADLSQVNSKVYLNLEFHLPILLQKLLWWY